MPNVSASPVVGYLRRLIDAREMNDLTDAQLLERFIGRREEAAFAALVRRHGTIVMGVCRHVLHHHQDAEDAFQATFLVLARKAAAIRKRAAVASWLHGVAYRIALKAKKTLSQRRRNEARAASRTTPEKPVSEAALRELQARLDEEVNRLPDKYRTPFILCCLTGKSREEAARQLGWKKGTVSSRVAKARALLKQRLARRGVLLTAALCAGALGQDKAGAAVATTLAVGTVRASLRFAAGAAAAAAPAWVLAWAEATMRAMAVSKLQAGAGILFVLGLFIGAAGLAANRALDGKPVAPTAGRESNLAAGVGGNGSPTDANGDPLPPGARLRLGETRLRTGAHTTHLAFSPDGQRLASWGNCLYHCDRLSLWDAATGKELRTERVDEGCLAALAWCADGRGFAVLTPWRRPNLKDFLVWEFTDPHVKNPAPARPGQRAGRDAAIGQGPPEYYGPFAIAPDGKWLAAYHAGGKRKPEATLFRLAAKQTVRGLKADRVIKNLPADARTLTFAGDNRLLVVSSYKDPGAATQTMTVFETSQGKRQKVFSVPMTLHQGSRESLTVSRDGTLLALGLEDGTARLFDLTSGRQIRSLAGHSGTVKPRSYGGVSTVAFSPDGKRLVTGGRDNVLKIWDVHSGRTLLGLHGHHSWPEATAFTADGKRFASSGQDCLIRIWDSRSGKNVPRPKGHSATVWGLTLSRDGRRALTSGWDGTARLWDLRTGAELRHFSQDGDSQAEFLDDHTILTHEMRRWRLWDTATGKKQQLPADLARGRGIAFGLSRDGRTLLTAEDQTVTVWSWPAGQRLRQMRASGRVLKALGTADGRTVLVVEESGKITIWDRRTGANQGSLPVRSGMYYPALVQLTDEGLVVAVGTPTQQPRRPLGHGDILVCDIKTRSILQEFPVRSTHPGVFYLLGLAVSRDGRTVAVGQSDGNAMLYEMITGQGQRRLTGHREAIPGLAFTPHGRLVTASCDHTCLVWDVGLRAAGQPTLRAFAEKEKKRLWEELGRPPAEPAFRALEKLAGDPQGAVALIRRQLPPANGIENAALDRIMKDLDSAHFKIRQRASRALDRLGETAVAGVRNRLAKAESLELRLRLEAFLHKYGSAKPSAERLREVRALQLLEDLATPEACALLRDLARGNTNARLTQEAGQALKRCRALQ
jgi:RNA polymerase sigma factor (sigma-70 family)